MLEAIAVRLEGAASEHGLEVLEDPFDRSSTAIDEAFGALDEARRKGDGREPRPASLYSTQTVRTFTVLTISTTYFTILRLYEIPKKGIYTQYRRFLHPRVFINGVAHCVVPRG